MEPNENQLSSFYKQQGNPHHQQHQHRQVSPTTTSNITPSITASPTNGLLPNAEGSHLVYPHSVPSAVSSQIEPLKRKRGRPRKYGTPEQALAAKKAAAAAAPSSSHSFSTKDKKELGLAGGSGASTFTGAYKKSQPVSGGDTGQGFTPHVISVAANEDVGQKIMMFMQQSKREICILSASGSISNASLRQPATSGGNITYEGLFDIITLSGSYVRTEFEGRTGGLSACLSSTDGQIIGGGVCGPLKAAGPVQVIVGTFLMDTKKDSGVKVDDSVNMTPLQVGGESMSTLGFLSLVDPSRGPVRGNGDHQAIGSSHFMLQAQSAQVCPGPTDWRGHVDARSSGGYDLTGHATHRSPENGGL